ncbi:MAG: hypothetical protein WBA45_11340 [Microthrixaceae bacterium]
MTVHPRTDELIESIRWSFENFVMPDLDDEYAISVAHTIRNLLKHVSLRIQFEGPALDAHRRELRGLLSEIRDYAASEVAALGGLPGEIDAALVEDGDDDCPLPGVIDLGEKVISLRWALDRALRALQAARSEIGDDERYVAIRQEIRECLARQLEREDAWMTPAFSGRRR